jgi:hypothetical protein
VEESAANPDYWRGDGTAEAFAIIRADTWKDEL